MSSITHFKFGAETVELKAALLLMKHLHIVTNDEDLVLENDEAHSMEVPVEDS